MTAGVAAKTWTLVFEDLVHAMARCMMARAIQRLEAGECCVA